MYVHQFDYVNNKVGLALSASNPFDGAKISTTMPKNNPPPRMSRYLTGCVIGFSAVILFFIGLIVRIRML